MARSSQLLLCGAFVSIVSAVLADDPESLRTGTTSTVDSRILNHLDRNGDGTLDRAEADRFPVPVRKSLRNRGLEMEWPIRTKDFGPVFSEVLADLRVGRFSEGAKRYRSFDTGAGTRLGRTASRPKPAPKSYPRVEVNGYEGLVAERTFTRLDKQPTDGKISRAELDEGTLAMFEGAGLDIPDEMDRDTFLQHHVRIQRSQQ